MHCVTVTVTDARQLGNADHPILNLRKGSMVVGMVCDIGHRLTVYAATVTDARQLGNADHPSLNFRKGSTVVGLKSGLKKWA